MSSVSETVLLVRGPDWSFGVNGRYRRPPKGHYRRFYNFFRFDQLKSRGIDVGVRYVMEMLIRKLLVRLGLYKV